MIDPRAPDYGDTPASGSRASIPYAPADPDAAPLITVLTASYNSTALICETARSLYGSSFQQWEWLIVDDASTDAASLDRLAAFAAADSRVRIVRHEVNRGLSAAMNTGFEHARGEFVFLLDDDDLLEPTALEKLWWHLRSYPQFAAANGWEVGFGERQYLWPHGFEHGAEFLNTNFATSRALIRKSAHAAVGGFDPDNRGGGMDWEFWLKLADHGMWGATVPEYLDWYRTRARHSDRWTNLDGAEGQRRFIQSLHERFAHLRTAFPACERPPDEPLAALSEPPVGVNLLRKTGPRLLMIVPWMALGGADKFNLDLVRRLAGAGWQISIAATVEGDNAWAADFARFTPDIFILHRYLRRADYPAFLRYLIASRRPDVVMVSNSEVGYSLLPYLREHAPEPAYVDYCHSESPWWKSGGYPRYSAARRHHLDRHIVASGHLRNWLAARGVERDRVDVAYINVDADHWAPCPQTRAAVRAELGIAADAAVILFAGRLHSDKQPAVLARSLARLAQMGGDFHALVAGDGPDLDWFERFCCSRGLDSRVRVLGACSPGRMLELYRAADVFFLPSRWEGIALTFYEAMACGLPIVGADVGGQRELVTPECGVLAPRGAENEEADRYAEILARLLGDADARARMGAAARRRIESEFTLDKLVENMVAAFARARGAVRGADLPPGVADETAAQAIEQLRLAEELERQWRLQIREDREQDERRVRCAIDSLNDVQRWSADEAGRSLLAAKCWFAEQADAWRTSAQARESWIDQLSGAKKWFEEQAAAWAETARRQQAWVDELEQARAWLLDQANTWRAAAERQQAWTSSVEAAKSWLAEQTGRWQATAADQSAWIRELESAKQWLVEQASAWEQTALAQSSQLESLKAWCDELQRGKDWLERAWRAAREEVDQLRAALQHLESQRLFRVLRSSRLLSDAEGRRRK